MPAKRTRSAPTPTASSAAAGQPAPGDTIAQNRTVPVLTPASLPPLPAGFAPTPAEECARRLRRLAMTQRAELLAALHELGGRGAQYQAELGDLAPEPAPAAPLAARLQQVREVIVQAEALLAYLYEVEAIAQSDAVELVEAVHTELVHRLPRKPALETAYKHVLTLFRQRSEAISEGIARAKKPDPAAPPETP